MTQLNAALMKCNDAHGHATAAAEAEYPIGAHVWVRTKRFGYAASEYMAVITAVRVNIGHWGASVHVNVRNIKSGKVTTRYPSVLVDGLPEVRIA